MKIKHLNTRITRKQPVIKVVIKRRKRKNKVTEMTE